MALYAIGDLHLSLGADKPMDVFGGPWENYVEKIKLGFSSLHDDDVCVLCGDLAWGMTMEQALPDFPAQGQPRLLVEHREKGLQLFCGARYAHHGHSQ